jgi:YgiT-type zinc finger domain-containing protein
MNRQAVPFQIDRNGVHLKFDSVPAWICRKCSETYYEESGVESIQTIIKAIDQEAEKLAAPR